MLPWKAQYCTVMRNVRYILVLSSELFMGFILIKRVCFFSDYDQLFLKKRTVAGDHHLKQICVF